MVHFLEVNQDGHTQVGCQRINATQLWTIRRDVKLHLAETLRSRLHGFREHVFSIGLRHVLAVEPGKASRRRRLKRLHLFKGGTARQQIRLRHAGAVEMREVAGYLCAKMEMQVEYGRTPFVRGHPLAKARRHHHGRGNRLDELTAIHEHLSPRQHDFFAGTYAAFAPVSIVRFQDLNP